MDEKEVFEICKSIDGFIAAYLTESIVRGISYDMLEAHYGILPISRRSFYRKRRIAQSVKNGTNTINICFIIMI